MDMGAAVWLPERMGCPQNQILLGRNIVRITCQRDARFRTGLETHIVAPVE
jgi:hypothetical protein